MSYSPKFANQSGVIPLTMQDILVTSLTLFKEINGWTFKWQGSDVIISDIWAIQAEKDSSGNQGYITEISINGTNNALNSNLTLSNSDNTYVQGTVNTTSSNLEITSGDTIEIDFTEGDHANATNLAVFLYIKDNQ